MFGRVNAGLVPSRESFSRFSDRDMAYIFGDTSPERARKSSERLQRYLADRI